LCDPVSLTLAATAVAAAGQGVGAIQEAAAYRYKAKIADQNARLASNAAHMAEENNRTEQQRLGRKIGQTQGAQIAAIGANGVDIGFGSSVGVLEDTAMLGGEDYGQLSRQGEQERLGYDINIGNYRAEKQANRQAASGALIKGAFDVATTVLGGATQVSKLKAGSK
jgi:hypothetical protein